MSHSKVVAVILGAGGNAAYNLIAALKLTDPSIWVIGTDVCEYKSYGANVDEMRFIPPVTDGHYEKSVLALAECGDVLIPQSDAETAFWAARSHPKTLLPRKDVITICQDKYCTAKILSSGKIPVAAQVEWRTITPAAFESLRSVTGKVWIRSRRGAGSKASLCVTSLSQAYGWVEYWSEVRRVDVSEFIAAEFLPGRDFAWQGLWYHGELVASVGRERLAYAGGNQSPTGQTSSASWARIVWNDELNAVAANAVKAVDSKPHGIFGVDCKEGTDKGIRITEINAGRCFTTVDFYARIGVNFPEMILKLVQGREVLFKGQNAAEAGWCWSRAMDRTPACWKE